MKHAPTSYDLAALERIEALEAFYAGRVGDAAHLRGAICKLLEAFEGVREIGSSNKGYWIDRFHAEVGLAPGQPWCVMLPQYVYRRAASWLGLPDPLPYNTAGTQALAGWAEREDLCRDHLSKVDSCDLLIWRNGRGSAQGHVGQATQKARRLGSDAERYLIRTIEGNTSAKDYRDGGIVAPKLYEYAASELGRVRSKRYLRCVVSFDALMDKYVFKEVQK